MFHNIFNNTLKASRIEGLINIPLNIITTTSLTPIKSIKFNFVFC